MTEFPPADRWLELEGVQRARTQHGERRVMIDGVGYWLPESEMEILEHDEQLGTIRFRLTRRAGHQLGLPRGAGTL